MMSPATECSHDSLRCLNQYELIRKYCCAECGAVMMCACEEEFGRRFLAHQLRQGVDLETQDRVPVTLGFRPAVCNGCRGQPLEPAPKAAIYGHTTKVKRFYWRELYFLRTERMADWELDNPNASEKARADARRLVEESALDEIKALHASAPKYACHEDAPAEILARCQVKIEAFHPDYVDAPERGRVVLLDGDQVSPEVFVARHFEALNWSAVVCESRPFHALFGVMMWLLVEHPSDPKGSLVGFGARAAFDNHTPGEQIWMQLPTDFGTVGYGRRRKQAIDEHFGLFVPDGYPDRGALLDLFDYWQGPSERFRQYLWAHRESDVSRARRLIEILPPEMLCAILRYLADNYWGRYLGWPDLLLHRGSELMFVEVKSPSDKLSAEQMRWIIDNHDILKLPFRIAKLHRPSRQVKNRMASTDGGTKE